MESCLRSAERTSQQLVMGPGTLYGTLKRMLEAGLIEECGERVDPGLSDERRRLRSILVSLVIGATAGGLLLIHAPIYAPVLPLVITVGVVAIAATTFRYRNEMQGVAVGGVVND